MAHGKYEKNSQKPYAVNPSYIGKFEKNSQVRQPSQVKQSPKREPALQSKKPPQRVQSVKRNVRKRKNPVKRHSFKMNRTAKRKLYALLAASALSLGGMKPLETSPAEVDPALVMQKPPKPEIIYTLGIANDDAEITVDGKKYKIDKNSFIIVSKDEALAYDVHGNMLKGQIDTTDFKAIRQMPEKEMAYYNISQITSNIDVNVRATGAILDNNIISTVPSYDYVLAYDSNTPENDKEWIYTLSINDDNLYEGYIREDLLKRIDTFEAIDYRVENQMDNMENIMYVNTAEDDYISLNLRFDPKASSSENIIAQIPYGSIVHILGERAASNDRIWTHVLYETLDGKQFQGWVAEDYLSSEIVQEKPNPENGLDIDPKNVTGIDFSTISPDDLRELLENGIPSTVKSKHGNFDTSQLAGKINYAYIKLGASPYGKGEFKPTEYNYYEEQVAICEELGIPYGFYYYSTAITVEEANIELNYIKECIKDLKEKYELTNYKLEIAVDIELENTSDRQYRGDIKKQTEAKAVLINGIQEQGLSDNVLIYGPIRVMKPNLDQIFDLQYLHTLLSNPDEVALWQCSLMKTNGNVQQTLEEDISYAEEQGFSTVMCQLLLDGTVSGRIDINSMNREHFDKLVNQENEITYQEDER